jgi:hypothetical protein
MSFAPFAMATRIEPKMPTATSLSSRSGTAAMVMTIDTKTVMPIAAIT